MKNYKRDMIRQKIRANSFQLKSYKMLSKNIFFIILILGCFLFYCCNSRTDRGVTDSSKNDSVLKLTQNKNLNLGIKTDPRQLKVDSNTEFERRIYFEIDQIYSGKVYSTKNNQSAFYRVLIVPEEENVMIIAENIGVLGEEGGNFKLIKLSRLTDDDSVLPKFGISSVDSLKFIDSVNIEGYFNNTKKRINLDKLKPYHPIF